MKKLFAASIVLLFAATGAVAAVPGAAEAISEWCCCF